MILIFLVMAGLVYVGIKQLGILEKINLGSSSDPEKKGVVLDKPERPADVSLASLPPSAVKAPERTSDNPPVTIGIWTWQTVSGIIDSVGGPGKSGEHPDSCLCQAGITNTQLVVQNDTSEQIKALSVGQMQLVTTTGDQSAVDLNGANELLRKSGSRVKVIWSSGYSFGEDCLIGPESWKKDPQLSRGAVVGDRGSLLRLERHRRLGGGQPDSG
jgi:hypothetical protein